MLNYIFACNKPWHLDFFLENRNRLFGNWSIATCSSDLEDLVFKLNPRFVFFPHWSDIVPPQIFEKCECVCFHMTELPYGRGGSPLQNLIVRGHSSTFITAFRMNKYVDAGPVYLRRKLDLSGSALDIFRRAAPICFEMMVQIQNDQIIPTEQMGEPTFFKRRTPEDSEIPKTHSIAGIYDMIRMMDAPGYPAAFLRFGNLKFEFTNANLGEDNNLNANVKVMIDEE